MTTEQDMQTVADNISAKMTAKGFREPTVRIYVTSHSEPSAFAQWKKSDASYDTEWHHVHGTMEKIFIGLNDWIEAQPTKEERTFSEFTRAVANAIELGKAGGIDATLVNPLEAAMKKLSKNALFHAPTVEAV